MAPILIDNRGLKKLGLIAVFIMLLSFAGGFFLGYQQATVYYAAGSENKPSSLPMKNVSLNSDIEQQAAEIVDAGKKVNVDQPEIKKSAIAQTKSIKKTDAEIKQQLIKQESSTTKGAITPVDKKSAAVIKSINASNLSKYNTQVVKSSPAIAKVSETAAVIKVNKQATPTVAATSVTTDEPHKTKYSIQVGIYGRLINAQKMKGKLQEQHLDSYVSDNVNKKSKFRYNVRFGYFVDKKSALTALKDYKKNQKGDGYLVNFSAENIIKVAEGDNIMHSDNESTSLTTAVDVLQDKSSQADTLKNSDVLKKSQEKPLVN